MAQASEKEQARRKRRGTALLQNPAHRRDEFQQTCLLRSVSLADLGGSKLPPKSGDGVIRSPRAGVADPKLKVSPEGLSG